MNIKPYFYFTFFCFVFLYSMSFQTAYSQTKTEEIMLVKGQLPLKINGFNFTAKIDQNSNTVELRLSLNELRELKKNKAKITNLKGDTTLLRGKNKHIKLTFNVDILHFSKCIVFANAPVRIDFYTDSATIQKPEITLKLLKKITNVDLTTKSVKFIAVEPPFLKKSCFTNLPNPSNSSGSSNSSTQQSPIIAVPSFSINQAIQSSLIRFVPCSLDASIQQKKSDLQQKLRASNCNQVEEETNVPPRQKAVAKINNGFTIRFFDTNDAASATDMETFIKANYPNDKVTVEDMSSILHLPKRLEIWIK